jgi:hypothetical protein
LPAEAAHAARESVGGALLAAADLGFLISQKLAP